MLTTLALLLQLAASISAFAQDSDKVPSGYPFLYPQVAQTGVAPLGPELPSPMPSPAEAPQRPGASALLPDLAAVGAALALHRGPEVCLAGDGADPLLFAEAAGAGDAGSGWPWRRVGGADYLAVSLAAAGAIYVESEYGRPEAKWQARNGFDESIRDALRLKGRQARQTAQTVGDVAMGVLIGAPVVDSLATLGIRDGRWDALWQTEMINLESFAFTSLVSAALQNLIAREKRFKRNCVNGRCEGDQENRSMPSGHVAFAFTGAGLLCSHHRYQSLYGDPATDRAVCATGAGLTIRY